MSRFRTQNRPFDDQGNPLSYFSDTSEDGDTVESSTSDLINDSSSNVPSSDPTSITSYTVNDDNATYQIGGNTAGFAMSSALPNSSQGPMDQDLFGVGSQFEELNGDYPATFDNLDLGLEITPPDGGNGILSDHSIQNEQHMPAQPSQAWRDANGLDQHWMGIPDPVMYGSNIDASMLTPPRTGGTTRPLHLVNDSTVPRRAPTASAHYGAHNADTVSFHTQAGGFTSDNMMHGVGGFNDFAPTDEQNPFSIPSDINMGPGDNQSISQSEYLAQMSASTRKASDQQAFDESCLPRQQRDAVTLLRGRSSRRPDETPTKPVAAWGPIDYPSPNPYRQAADPNRPRPTPLNGSPKTPTGPSFQEAYAKGTRSQQRVGDPLRPIRMPKMSSKTTIKNEAGEGANMESEYEDSESEMEKARKRKRGGMKTGTGTEKINKDGQPRKSRAPRAPLRKWDENDLIKALIGVVWSCGEAGVQIPFDQAAQLIDDTCTASALQQAILKLHAQMIKEGKQLPKIKMHWPKKGGVNSAVNRDAGKVPRRKPTTRRGDQSFIITLKRAYIETDRAALVGPYTGPKYKYHSLDPRNLNAFAEPPTKAPLQPYHLSPFAKNVPTAEYLPQGYSAEQDPFQGQIRSGTWPPNHLDGNDSPTDTRRVATNAFGRDGYNGPAQLGRGGVTIDRADGRDGCNGSNQLGRGGSQTSGHKTRAQYYDCTVTSARLNGENLVAEQVIHGSTRSPEINRLRNARLANYDQPPPAPRYTPGLYGHHTPIGLQREADRLMSDGNKLPLYTPERVPTYEESQSTPVVDHARLPSYEGAPATPVVHHSQDLPRFPTYGDAQNQGDAEGAHRLSGQNNHVHPDDLAGGYMHEDPANTFDMNSFLSEGGN